MMQLFRSTIFHTPDNPFFTDSGFHCFHDGGLLVEKGRIVACGDYHGIRDANRAAQTVDMRGGFILPGFVDAHVHFPQVRIIGAMGRTLLDWLEYVALPEEARMADVSYAKDTAQLFLRALASHGTTTALVFGAHFADATAELFEAARGAGLRIISGLVMSDRHASSRAPCDSRTCIRRELHADRAIPQTRPSAVRRHAPFCLFGQ